MNLRLWPIPPDTAESLRSALYIKAEKLGVAVVACRYFFSVAYFDGEGNIFSESLDVCLLDNPQAAKLLEDMQKICIVFLAN